MIELNTRSLGGLGMTVREEGLSPYFYGGHFPGCHPMFVNDIYPRLSS